METWKNKGQLSYKTQSKVIISKNNLTYFKCLIVTFIYWAIYIAWLLFLTMPVLVLHDGHASSYSSQSNYSFWLLNFCSAAFNKYYPPPPPILQVYKAISRQTASKSPHHDAFSTVYGVGVGPPSVSGSSGPLVGGSLPADRVVLSKGGRWGCIFRAKLVLCDSISLREHQSVILWAKEPRSATDDQRGGFGSGGFGPGWSCDCWCWDM